MYSEIRLTKRPDETFPANLDVFQTVQNPIPQECPEEHLLIKVLYVGIDPVMRVWLSGAKTYVDAVELGDVVPAFGIGVVIQANAKKWKKDDIVFGVLRWAEYCVIKAKTVHKAPMGVDLTFPFMPQLLSVFGVTGVTAVLAFRSIDEADLPTKEKPKTLVVSSAAGSTGASVVQIAKFRGYRVVGIVSGREKAEWVKSLGAADCVCYNDVKDKDGQIDTNALSVLIHKACPEGIDVYFDNTGEESLDAVLPNMNAFGNVILCGATATYNQWKNRGGLVNLPSLISKRVKAYGIIYYQDPAMGYSGFAEIVELVNDGHVRSTEEILDGLENAPFGLQKVFQGKNLGKIIIKVAKDFQLQRAKL